MTKPEIDALARQIAATPLTRIYEMAEAAPRGSDLRADLLRLAAAISGCRKDRP